MSTQKNTILPYIFVAFAALAVGIFGYRFFVAPKPLELINTFPKLNPLVSFNANDHKGNEFTEKDFIGKWSIVFFGFTTCPDICPTTMMDMSQVSQGLNSKWKSDTQFVFVTVDPERDTVQVLSKYVPAFNKDFIGITMDLKQTSALTKNLGVSFMKSQVDSENPKSYMVDHTARWFIIDPLGRRHGLINPSDAYGKDLVSIAISDYESLRQQVTF